MKSSFSGLQFLSLAGLCSFIRLAVIVSHICKIMRNSDKIYETVQQFKVIQEANRKLNFLLVINSDFGESRTKFEILHA